MMPKNAPEEINPCGNLKLKGFNPPVKQNPVRETVIIVSSQLKRNA
jgi:hypothetical protein